MSKLFAQALLCCVALSCSFDVISMCPLQLQDQLKRLTERDCQELDIRISQLEYCLTEPGVLVYELNGRRVTAGGDFYGREEYRLPCIKLQGKIIEAVLDKYSIPYPKEKTLYWLNHLKKALPGCGFTDLHSLFECPALGQ